MSVPFTVAAVLLFLIGLNHSTLGEKYIVVPILKMKGLPPLLGSEILMRQMIRASWHIVTLQWWGSALFLLSLQGSLPDASSRLATLSLVGINAATALLIMLCSRAKHFSWPVFATIAACIWYGR